MQCRMVLITVEPNNDDDNGSSRLEESSKLSQPILCVKTCFIKKKTGHCHRRLPPEQNRRPNMQTRSIS